MATEDLHPLAMSLDLLPAAEALARLLQGHLQAVQVVESALPALEAGAALMSNAIANGGNLIYAGAGSSALMAVADGTEIPGTFGISADRIRLCMAGGIPKDSNMPGGTEDDTSAGELVGSKVARTDLVIAISASGSTPYTVGLVRAAKDAGAKVVAIANNPDADLFNFADVSVLLETPPEIISGSTRLGAATAQKVALNLMSSLMGLRIGNVYDGMMVGVVADNDKLRKRARSIVSTIAQVDTARAEDSLASAGGAVKNAVLIALGASPTNANKILQEEQGLLRNAIARVSCDNNKCS